MQKSSVAFACSACGPVAATQLQVYRSDGVFNAQSLRVGPWCPTCGRRLRAEFAEDDGPLPESNPDAPSVLLLSGSCASGKTTISYLLAGQANAIQIDGDWLLHLLKEEAGRAIPFKDADLEICRMAEAFVRLGKRVVIAQVVLPDTIEPYTNYFMEKGISYQFIVLMPSQTVILERNETRKCWPKTTPEYWVLKFRADLEAGPKAFRAAFYDNSNESPEMTASNIMAKCHWSVEREGTVR
jgi:predicted kinase